MAHIKALVTIGHSSGVPENAATNTLHFSTPLPVPTSAELDEIMTATLNFYSLAVPSTGLAVSALYSFNMAGGAKFVTLYNMADPPPRVPLRQEPFTTFGLGLASFPLEVALVLSFRSATPSGVPLSRRRVGSTSALSVTTAPVSIAPAATSDPALRRGTPWPAQHSASPKTQALTGRLSRLLTALSVPSCRASWTTPTTPSGGVGRRPQPAPSGPRAAPEAQLSLLALAVDSRQHVF